MPDCKRPTSLPTISKVLCAINVGQMVALIFQRRQTVAPFATDAAAKLKASWDAFFDADGDTKMVKTPEFANFVIPGTEAVYINENSNASIGGVGTFVGYNAAKATGQFQSTPFDIIKQLRPFEAESAPGLDDGITAYIVTEDKRIVASRFDETGTGIGGIVDVTNFNVADRSLEGFRTVDGNNFGLTLAAGWSDNLVIIEPEFNPRRLLNA